jgi:putative membrane protein
VTSASVLQLFPARMHVGRGALRSPAVALRLLERAGVNQGMESSMKTRQGMMIIAAGCLLSSAAWSASSTDTSFAKKAARGGLAEVAMGRLAESHAQSADVKAFGQKMVQDHGAANDKLKVAAEQEHVPLPTRLSPEDQKTLNHLSPLHGEAFDKAYAQTMVKDHKKDIAEFKQEAQSGTASQIQTFAQATLPTLQEHLQMAEKLPEAAATPNGQ